MTGLAALAMGMRIRGRLTTMALVPVAALVAAGCTASAGGGDKAGGGGGQGVLKLAEGTATFETDPAVADFVRRGGGALARALEVKVGSHLGGGGPPRGAPTRCARPA